MSEEPARTTVGRQDIGLTAKKHFEEHQLTPCSRCQRRHLALWSNNAEQLCEGCFDPDDPGSHPDWSHFRLLFCPHLQPDGSWTSKPSTPFSFLREFVEKSMRPKTAAHFRELLVSSPRAIQALIDHLESKIIVPQRTSEFMAQAERMKSLRKSLRRPREELKAFTQVIRELERKMSQGKDVAARKILKKEGEAIGKRASAKQLEFESIARQIRKLDTAIGAFLEAHPSKVQKHAVERLRREFAKWQRGELELEFKGPICRVYWELLKPAGDSWPEIVRHYQYLQRVHNERYELQRLKQIHDLHPDLIYIGLASFEGYVVFVFKRGNVAVLDCPRVGNALYLMDASNWRFFSQLSKTQLLSHHQNEVRRIIHGWRWFYDLQRNLERRASS